MYITINDYKNMSARSLAEDIANGFELTPTTILAINAGLDDYTLVKVIANVDISIPDDPDNLDGTTFSNTKHYVLQALDPELNQIRSPEIAEPFYQILPYNYQHLHVLFDN